MEQSIPEFGSRVAGAMYVNRPGAYAIISADDGRVAFVHGKSGQLFLPGGRIESGETPEEALLREIREEIGWTARILHNVGSAIQLLFAGDEGYFALQSTYYRVELVERISAPCEHEIIWLARELANPLARQSDGWATWRAFSQR